MRVAASAASAPEGGDRRVHQRTSVSLLISVRRKNVLSTNRHGRGLITNSSVAGAQLHTDYPLDIGEWVYLKVAEGESLGEARAGDVIKAQVVRQIRADAQGGDAPGFIFGLSFPRGVKAKFSYWLYHTFPLLLGLLFLLGLINVGYMKSLNLEHFWYQPLLNFYSILISLFILSRLVVAIFYRPPEDADHMPTVSVIVACMNEAGSIGRTLDVIYQSDYPAELMEVIAVDDGSTDSTLEEMYQVKARHPDLNIIEFKKNRGKRHGMYAGAHAATGEILVYIDSDSFVRPDTLYKIVQGFADKEVAAVCGHADVENARSNLLTKMQEVRYYVAFRIVKAAESVFSTVSCCSGCLAAYRREYVMPVLDSWVNQRFLGTEATFGDDRALTNCMLKRYRVIYHSEAVCTTIVPEKYGVFFRQQLRWKKSWIRETLIACTFIWRRHPVAAITYYLGAIFPFVGPAVVFSALALPLFGGASYSLIYLYGALLMSWMYCMVYWARYRDSLWIYGIYFTVLYMFVLAWQTYYALFTVHRNHWGTR